MVDKDFGKMSAFYQSFCCNFWTGVRFLKLEHKGNACILENIDAYSFNTISSQIQHESIESLQSKDWQ